VEQVPFFDPLVSVVTILEPHADNKTHEVPVPAFIFSLPFNPTRKLIAHTPV
jgi:hypothetical protein